MRSILSWIGAFVSLALITLAFGAGVFAARPTQQLATVDSSGDRATVVIPDTAIEVAPGVFSLGISVDEGRVVEGYAFIDYKRGHAKPGTECGNDICEPGENAKKCPADCGDGGEEPDSSCYGFLAKGAKWKTVEDYIVDTTNNEGLSAGFISGNFAADITKWETAAAGTDILGDEIPGVVDGADTVTTDGKNEVYFGDVAQGGAIGVTIVWGIFRGPPGGRELVEWDQVYDEADFDWSASGEAGKMDFENIATHELGHSVGLDDLYSGACTEETMYGYASEGETKKRSLEVGDIAGVSELYK